MGNISYPHDFSVKMASTGHIIFIGDQVAAKLCLLYILEQW